MPTAAFLVDFADAADVIGKRRALRQWSEGALRAALHRNRIECLNDPESTALRRLLSGSVLVRCELARRTAQTVLDTAAADHGAAGSLHSAA